MNKIIYVDMDDTIADFTGHPVFNGEKTNEFSVHAMYEPGFFLSLKPIEGALTGVRALIRLGYDVHILTQPLAESAHSYQEKVQWIGLHFPELIKKIHMTQDKGLFVGGYLIDDNDVKWKAKFEANGGKFIHFKYSKYHRSIWCDIVEFFKAEAAK
jgi:5'(3')-deoxyribonucleotidase